MPRLESLSFLHLYYANDLDNLLHRCSALRSLSISNLHLNSIVLNLRLLEELLLSANVMLRRVTITAPRLKKLTFHARGDVTPHFTVMCLAPKVEDLSWEYTNNCTLTDYFGDVWNLQVNVAMKASQPLGLLLCLAGG
jgi:hypothetical protein